MKHYTINSRHMRTIPHAYQFLQQADPDTDITLSGFRRFVTTGKIPSVMAGKKYLIALEDINHFLHNGFSTQNENYDYEDGIRAVPPRIE